VLSDRFRRSPAAHSLGVVGVVFVVVTVVVVVVVVVTVTVVIVEGPVQALLRWRGSCWVCPGGQVRHWTSSYTLPAVIANWLGPQKDNGKHVGWFNPSWKLTPSWHAVQTRSLVAVGVVAS